MQRLCPGLLTACLCAMVSFWPVTQALAQQRATSTGEEVGMAFFKTGGATPDFAKMATGSREYRLTPVARRDKFIAGEKQRLAKIFHDYDPQTELLRVRTGVLVDLAGEAHKDGTETYSMTISFKQGDVSFFPFQYQDYDIAVIPQQLQTYLHQSLSADQYKAMKAALDGNDQGLADLSLELKPVKAYLDRPYDIGGQEQWALLANVAGLTLDSKEGAPLWNYSAPWYVSPVTEDLRGIYSSKAQQKQQEMDLENPLRPAP